MHDDEDEEAMDSFDIKVGEEAKEIIDEMDGIKE
jgi:hypothetical protein